MWNIPFTEATSYTQQEVRLSYAYGNPDNFEDYNDNDRRLLQQGLFGVLRGDNTEVRKIFNKRFNDIIAYHSTLWRDTPHNERNKAYYAERYKRFFEDIFRLCEKFPDLPTDREYQACLNAYSYYHDVELLALSH